MDQFSNCVVSNSIVWRLSESHESTEVECSLIDWTSPFLIEPRVRVVFIRKERCEERRVQ